MSVSPDKSPREENRPSLETFRKTQKKFSRCNFNSQINTQGEKRIATFNSLAHVTLYKNHKNWNWNLTVLYFFENFQYPFFILTYVMIRNFTVLSLKIGGTCTLAPTKNNLKDFVLYVYFFVINLTSFRVKLKLSVVMP